MCAPMWAFAAICEVTKRRNRIMRIFPLARPKADANRAPLPGPCHAGMRASDVQSGRSSGVEHNLAKVGVEGSNPFARSNHFNGLFDRAFAAKSGLTACDFTGVLIGTLAGKWPKRAI